MPIDPSFVRRAVDAIEQSRRVTSTAHLPIASAERSLGLSLTPGDVVVDLATGQEGVINAGYSKIASVQPAKQ